MTRPWTRLRREGSEGSKGSKGSEGKVLKMDGPSAQGFLSLTAFQAEGCGLPCRAMLIKSALRDLLFYIIGLDWHSADWLAALAPLWWLRHHLSPASGGTTNRAKLRVTYEKIASRSFVLPPLAGEVPRSGQGRMPFPRLQGGCMVFTAKGGIRNGAEGAVPRQRARSANQ